MDKFTSVSRNIEVIGYSKHLPAFLNRQIIVLLLGLGIQESVFKDLQVSSSAKILLSFAWRLLHGSLTSIAKLFARRQAVLLTLNILSTCTHEVVGFMDLRLCYWLGDKMYQIIAKTEATVRKIVFI